MLEKIHSPQDLKSIAVEKLPDLAQEIRERIISVISQRGGHLASSLGAVDLTIALHYCLATPRDILIWDVGHQSYAHKIITGRNDRFDTIRQYRGLSGFPTAGESPYDVFTVGHSSTSISLATGMAVARDLQAQDHRVVAVIGDGSLSGGMCFEAFNNAGHLKRDMIVVLNTNEMSISPNVGAVSTYLNKFISLPIYNRIKAAIEDFMKMRIPRIGRRLTKIAYRFEEMLKGLIVPGIFFEELGFRYFGPFDGHNIPQLITDLNNIKNLKGPILFHVVTKKGKGFAAAEKEPELFHSAPPFHINSGKPVKKSTHATYTKVFGSTMMEIAAHNPRLIGITAAMTIGTGLCAFAKKYPKRFFDVGIAEQHAVTFAAGLAKGGYRPVVAIYSTFLQRAFDQIVIDVCLQNVPVVFCLDRAGLVGGDGQTHQGVFDVVYLRSLPRLTVMAPANADELELMLRWAVAHDGPVAIRYPKDTALPAVLKPAEITLGKAQVLVDGREIALVAIGAMVPVALQVRKLLLQRGIQTKVVNGRFAKPIDVALLRALSQKHKWIFTFEDGCINGGFGSAVLETLTQRNGVAATNTKASIYRFGVPSQFIPHAQRDELFALYGLTPEQVTKKIVELIV